MSSRDILVRQFTLAMELAKHPRGVSADVLARKIRVSRATLYRDLKLLKERVGLPVQKRVVGGEARLWLEPSSSIVLEATPLQIAALRIARQALGPIAGTRLVRELDKLLGAYGSRKSAAPPPYITKGDPAQPCPADVVSVLDQAMRDGLQVHITYRAASRGGKPADHRIDPLLLRWVDDTLYLYGYSHERDGGRVFKVARIASAQLLAEPAVPHTNIDLDKVFTGSVKAWTGALQRVRIRLSPEVAWLAPEYPLLGTQRIKAERDGSAIVEAETAGDVEAQRWAMSWGAHAEVLEPESLRTSVVAELAGMTEVYRHRESGGQRGSRKPATVA